MPLATLIVLGAASLVGTWAIVKPHRDASLPVEQCATDHGVRYQRSGRYSDLMGDEQGRWRLKGNFLTAHVTQRYDDMQRSVRVREEPVRSRLTWLSPNHVNVSIGDEVFGLIRCP